MTEEEKVSRLRNGWDIVAGVLTNEQFNANYDKIRLPLLQYVKGVTHERELKNALEFYK